MLNLLTLNVGSMPYIVITIRVSVLFPWPHVFSLIFIAWFGSFLISYNNVLVYFLGAVSFFLQDVFWWNVDVCSFIIMSLGAPDTRKKHVDYYGMSHYILNPDYITNWTKVIVSRYQITDFRVITYTYEYKYTFPILRVQWLCGWTFQDIRNTKSASRLACYVIHRLHE